MYRGEMFERMSSFLCFNMGNTFHVGRLKNSMDGTPKYGLFKINFLLLSGIRYFTLLDIENSYLNMPIKDGNNYTNGFLTPLGSWICEEYYIWIIILA
jgi:hypothetical protein